MGTGAGKSDVDASLRNLLLATGISASQEEEEERDEDKASKEQAVGTGAGNSDVDASLRNLLLASQEENAYSDIDSLHAWRMRNSSGMLSLPVPHEPASPVITSSWSYTLDDDARYAHDSSYSWRHLPGNDQRSRGAWYWNRGKKRPARRSCGMVLIRAGYREKEE